MKKAILFLAVSASLMISCDKEATTLVVNQQTSDKERVIDLVDIYGSEEEAKAQLELETNADPFIFGDEKGEFIKMMKNYSHSGRQALPASYEILNMPRVLNQGATNACGTFAASIVHSKVILNSGTFGNFAWNDNRQRSPWFIWSKIQNSASFWGARNIGIHFSTYGCANLNEVPNSNSPITNAIDNSADDFNVANFITRGNGRLTIWAGRLSGDRDNGMSILKRAISQYNAPVSVLFYTDGTGSALNLTGNQWSNNRPTSLNMHYMTLYGYDDARQVFLVQNSWGAAAHGGNGKFEITYDKMRRNWVSNVVLAMRVTPVNNGPQ